MLLNVNRIFFLLTFFGRTAMTTLMINDLSMTEQLDPAQMSSIQGGMIKLPREEPIGDEPGGPAGANVPAIWNNGVDGPIIARG
jgi:hypothetical protein